MSRDRIVHMGSGGAFEDYVTLIAELTRLGSSYDRSMRLENRSNNSLVGEWGRNRAGVIVPKGEISLDRVSSTPVGTAASVAGAVVTVSAGHSLATLSKVLRCWNVSDALLVADVPSGLWSVAGNDVLMPAATATAIAALLGASKVVRIHVEGVSEFSVGGAGADVVVASGRVQFDGALLVANGSFSMLRAGLSPKYWRTAPQYSRTDSAPSDNSYGGSGVWWSPTKFIGIVRQRISGVDTAKIATGTLSSPTLAAGAITVAPVGATSGLSLCRNQWNGASPIVNGTIEAAVTDGGSAVVDASTYVGPIGVGFCCLGAAGNVVTLAVSSLC
jgi:hypothetical protein